MSEFYICRHCGNVVEKVIDSKVPVVCCGEKMEKLVPNTVEASGEKHLPVVKVEGNLVTVNVGAVDHPMSEEHLIEWVQLKTDKGSQRKFLNPGDAPVVRFELADEKPLEVYAYCNLHGLWMSKL
ncbi:MAG: desulfoferrodoxin [Clostridia bacterium]|nr:desulfoferrodoxin [Clostridia bacterium]